MGDLDDFLLTPDWADITVRLTAFALRKTGDPLEAQEVTQEALSRLFDANYKPWSPEAPTRDGLLLHLGSIVNGLLANQWRLRKRRGRHIDIAYVGDELPSPIAADAHLTHDDWECEVLARLEDDEDACKLFYVMVDNVPKAKDEADELGWPVKKVYEVRRRIKKKLKKPSEES